MAGAGFRGGGGLGFGVAVIDPNDRGKFIDQIVTDFDQSRMNIDAAVVSFIKKETIVGEPKWALGLKSGQLNPATVRQVLLEALETSASAARAAGHSSIDMSIARPTFIEVVEGRWRCPYGFLLC